MLCLAFFSPSSSFLSASSSSSFFPNLILSTRLIELTKPQKFKGKRASISCWGQGRAGRLGPWEKVLKPLHPNRLQGDSHPHLGVYTYSEAAEVSRLTHLGTPAVPRLAEAPTCAFHVPYTITYPRCPHIHTHSLRASLEAGPPARLLPAHSGVSQP